MKKKIFITIKNIYSVLSKRRKIQTQLLILFSLLNGLLESVSIGMVLVYGNIILFPDQIKNFSEKFLDFIDVNSFINSDNFLFNLTFFFVFVIVVSSCLKILFGYFQAKIVNGCFYDLNILFYNSVLKKKYKDLADYNPNEILAILGKLNTVIYSLTSIISLISSLIIFMFIFIAMSLINLKLILISSISLILFYFFVIKFTSKKINEIGDMESYFQGKALELVNISIKSYKDIILHNSKKYFVNNFSKIIKNVCNVRIISFVINDAPRNIIIPSILLILIIFTYNYSKLNDLTLLLPEIAALIFSIQRVIPAINTMFNSSVSIGSAYQTNEDVFMFIKKNKIINPQIDNSNFTSDSKNKITFSNIIKFKNFSFGYEKNISILSSLNFEIKKGEKIAITGKNGSGKSTLINILMGFYDEYDGQIIIDEKNLNDSNLKSWQSKISYVPQKLFLFDDTIKNNITLGQDNIFFNEEKFKKASTISRVSEFVEPLEKKYETIVKDEGTRFSGGQIQKISLARAIYFSKDILVLDEFTNQVDNDSELQIIKDLFSEFKDSTIVLITHNQEIKKMCREINLS